MKPITELVGLRGDMSPIKIEYGKEIKKAKVIKRHL